MSGERIAILTPSRGRPGNIQRLYQSLVDTTKGEWELLVRLDSDDPSEPEYRAFTADRLQYITGPRDLLSKLWNDLVPYAFADIFMHGGDDITFNTKGWDDKVKRAFPKDGIAFVHGDDLSPNAPTLGTHGFVSKKWILTLGYLCPPHFASDYNDLWLNEVANALGRRIFLPTVVTEHHHPAFGKGDWDQTHQERIERHQAEHVDMTWRDTAPQRLEDIEKLRRAIDAQHV